MLRLNQPRLRRLTTGPYPPLSSDRPGSSVRSLAASSPLLASAAWSLATAAALSSTALPTAVCYSPRRLPPQHRRALCLCQEPYRCILYRPRPCCVSSSGLRPPSQQPAIFLNTAAARPAAYLPIRKSVITKTKKTTNKKTKTHNKTQKNNNTTKKHTKKVLPVGRACSVFFFFPTS